MKLVAHRIMLLPNNTHRENFRKAVGIARFTWNWALCEWERQYAEGGKPSALALKKQFVGLIDEQWPWIRDVSTYVIQQPFADLSTAWQRFFKKLGNRPKYKCKGKCRDSFYLANTAFRIDGNHVTISRLGKVRMAEELRFQGKIMSARVNREADRWYISICIEIEDQPAAHRSTQSVSIETGIRVMAVLSNGERVENSRALEKNLKRMARLQRGLARQERGSARYEEQKLAIAKLHRRIANVRSNALHQLTSDVTKRFSEITIRDQGVKDMMQDRRFARGLSNVAMGEFKRQMIYKAERTGADLVLAPRETPTSMQCSHCGEVNELLTLSQIVWQCPSCRVQHDREDNAARNLLDFGKNTRRAREINARGLDGSGPQGTTSQVETRTRLGNHKPASGSQTATHSG